MATAFMTAEGYDGSGKSTLVTSLARAWRSDGHLRVVGRKDEPDLRAISTAIENPTSPPHPEVEMLMRIALETQRGRIIDAAVTDGGLVACDRGIISLRAWFGYLGLRADPYRMLFERIEQRYRRSLMIVCTADFDTCWERVTDRSDLSAKEQQGKDANRRFFEMYEESVEQHIADGFDVIRLDTASLPAEESAAQAITELTSRRLWRRTPDVS